MAYLFAAYSVIWLLLAGYIFTLGKRQSDIAKQLKFLQELEKK
ncbi:MULTISPECIES: CcmD family protein [Anaerobacillus]|nr:MULTISPECIES: CcmD family protein [Anaerobacillus]